MFVHAQFYVEYILLPGRFVTYIRMPWKVGGNFEAVAICYDTNWRDCIKAVASYFWSEVVSDVVDYIAREELIWILVAVTSLILIHIKYRKTTYSKTIVLDNQILSNMIHTLQDLELKVNVLTYKMQYGTLPLPHEIYNLNSRKSKRIKLTLSSPCDRKTWIKHMLLSEGTEALSSSRKIKKTMFPDERIRANKEEITKKRKQSRENKDVEGYSRSDVNVPADANGAFSAGRVGIIPLLPTVRATHNVQSSRQMLHEVKRKLRSLHNILRMYQRTSGPTGKFESIDRVDEIDAFIFIKPEVKEADRSKPVTDRDVGPRIDLRETRSSRMTDSCEYCELDCSRESSSPSIGRSSNASTGILQRSVEGDLPALVGKLATDRDAGPRINSRETRSSRDSDCEYRELDCSRESLSSSNGRASNASTKILQKKRSVEGDLPALVAAKPRGRYSPDALLQEDRENKSSEALMCAQNISNWSCSENDSNVKPLEADRDATKIYLNTRSNNLGKKLSGAKQICYILSAESFGGRNPRTKTETSPTKEYSIAKFGDVFDKGNAMSGGLNEVSDSSDREEKSTALLLQEALRFKKALLTRIRSSVKNRNFPEERLPSLRRNMNATSKPFVANVGDRSCIIETPSAEYFSVTDVRAICDNDTTESGVSSSLRSAVRENDKNTIRIESVVRSLGEIDETSSHTGTNLRGTRNRVKSRENSEETDLGDLTKVRSPSVPRLQDLILTHVRNIRNCADNFLRSRSRTISTARRALRCRDEGTNISRSSNEASRATSRDRSGVDPVVGFPNDSPNLSINACYKSELSAECDTFESCTDVRLNPKVFAFITPHTFDKNDNTQPLETERKETDLLLPISLKYRGGSDSRSVREVEYVTSRENDKTHERITADVNMDIRRHVQINESKGYVNPARMNDGSNLISRNDSSYIVSETITAWKSMSNTDHSVKSDEEEAGVLILNDSEEEVSRENNVTLNPLCLLLGIERPVFNAGSSLSDLTNRNNEVSANINCLQRKAKSDTFLTVTSKNKGLNFSLRKSHSFSTRDDTFEHIRKLLRQSCTKLHNSKVKRIENKSQPVARATSVISPRRTFTRSSVPITKNHLEVPARRMKHHARAQSPPIVNTSVLRREESYTNDEINRYSCAERTALNLTELNAGRENSVEQSERYAYNSGFGARITEHVESIVPDNGVIVISIIENNNLQKRNLIYKNGLWSEESLEEKEVTAKPSIADTCTSISDLH